MNFNETFWENVANIKCLKKSGLFPLSLEKNNFIKTKRGAQIDPSSLLRVKVSFSSELLYYSSRTQ